MDFDPDPWHDGRGGGTSLNAARLNARDAGIVEGVTKAEAAQTAAASASAAAAVADGKAVAAQATADASTGRAIAFSIALG